MTFRIEKVSNMVFITSDCETIFKAWNVEDFSERKLANAIKKIRSNYNEEVKFTRNF